MAYTDIDDPSAHFQVTEYTGDGNTGRTVTNGGNSDLHPDIVWIKYRTAGVSHVWYDSSRGATKRLYVDFNSTEATQPEGVQAFSSDGFTLGNAGASNQNTIPYVAWQWHMNAGSTSSNTDGSTTSTVQVNSDAGMSIVQYTGNGTDGTTVGHGLGAKPGLIIGKSVAAAYDWQVRHKSTGGDSWPWNSTGAANTSTSIWSSTEPTTSVFSLNSAAVTNRSGYSQIAYCFVEKQGFSKFGSFVGNGNTNGAFVYTGFKPAFVSIKTGSQNWHVWDSTRNPSNVANKYIASSTSAAEATSGGNIDILSNGFKLRATDGAWNGSGTTYIYIAFAESPLVTSSSVPTTAR